MFFWDKRNGEIIFRAKNFLPKACCMVQGVTAYGGAWVKSTQNRKLYDTIQ